MSAAREDKPGADPLIGEVLANRYQIEHRLGEGAMGAVYRAKHVKVGRPFAVKILHARLLDDAKVAERFEREAELAGRLRHPNLIGVVDVGETHGRRYLVMDFAEGRDLAGLLSEAPMPAARVINLTRQMLEGLYHAHEQGLIHRDFKPENVIVERDSHDEEVPRIVDFGIAILREAGDSAAAPGRLTTNGLVLGTPHYMAPEQAVADPIDHRIDLFALGIIIYEMLCGKLPFDGSGAEVARANLLLDPPPIARRVPFLEVDPLLEAFARRLMAKRRDERPATAKAARELLDLITLDPDAAARELDVAPDARLPSVTAPIPMRPIAAPARARTPGPAADDGRGETGDTDEQAMIGSREPEPEPEPEAPAVARTSTPRALRAPVGPRGLATETTKPLAYAADDADDPPPRRSRTPLVIAVGVAAAMGISAALVVAHGRNQPDPAPAPAPVAMQVTATPVAPTPVAPAPVAPTPIAPAPVAHPVAPAPILHPAHSLNVAAAPITPPPVASVPVAPVPVAPVPVAPVPVAPTPVAPTPVPHPVSHPVASPPVEVTARALAALYASVGDDITALQKAKGIDAARDLWQRYRRIQLGSAMGQPAAQRAETAGLLGALRREALAARK